jgi:hypothetical protein
MHPDTTDNELEEIAKVIQATYNDLNEEDFCVPLMRRIEEMAVSAFIGFDESSSTGGCANVEVVFDVLGECRGCEDDISLVDESGKKNEKIRHRDLEHFSSALPTRRRGLKNTDFCFCNKKTRANRAPTLGELEEALEKTFEKLNSDLLCGLAKEDTDRPPESKSPIILPSTMPSVSPTTCTADLSLKFTSQVILSIIDGDMIDALQLRMLL